MRCREGGRKLSVDTADGIDRKFCKVDNGGRDDNRNQRSRNLVGDFRPEQHDDNGCGAYSGGSPVDGGNICGVGNHFIHEPGRHGCDGESEEILELADKQGHSDTAGKTGCDGIRNIFNERTKVADSHYDQKNAGKNGCDSKTCRTVIRDNAIDDDYKGCRRTTDLHTAAAEKRDKKSSDDGSVETLLRPDAGCDGKRDRQWQGNDGNDDTGDHVAQGLFFAVVL